MRHFLRGLVFAGAACGVPRRRQTRLRRLAAGAVLLAQVQFLCLTALHHHDLSGSASRNLTTAINSIDGQQAPGEQPHSCPICRFVRHNLTPSPGSIAFSYATFSSKTIVQLTGPKPLVAPRHHLTGRDPPSSLFASC